MSSQGGDSDGVKQTRTLESVDVFFYAARVTNFQLGVALVPAFM